MALNVPASQPIGNDNTLDPKLSHQCAPKHWDATRIFRRTVPQGAEVSLPTDPRPYAKICQQQRTTSPFEMAPKPPEKMVFPMGGEFQPPNRQAEAIDRESSLRRLDRPLNNDILPGDPCVPNQYTMMPTSDALQQQSLLPPQMAPKSKIVRELQDPAVLDPMTQQKCSKEAMICEIKGADRMWNNFTKLTKFKAKGTPCGESQWGYVNGKDASATNLPQVQDTRPQPPTELPKQM